MLIIRLLGTLAITLGTGLAFNGYAGTFVRDDIIADPDPARFTVCYDHGCASLATVTLSPEQWLGLSAVFAKPADTPHEVREQIGTAIARFVTVVAAITGTANDKGGNWPGFGLARQMDCIDESTNTTIYLRMLHKYGLLRWHSVEEPSTRWSLFSWVHSTAVIREHESRERWAVDSWFLDNGEPPFVLPLDTWRKGWKPFRLDPPDSGGSGRMGTE